VTDFDGTAPIMSSHFQISTIEGTWETSFLDISRDWENIYGTTGSPYWNPLDHNSGIDLTELNLNPYLFQIDHSYKWRVRYRDQNLDWSEWSAEKVFEYKGPSSTANEGLPIAFTLEQNYPTPFNPSTTISYGIPEDLNVSLMFTDISGRHIKTMALGLQRAGNYTVNWDGTDASGRPVSSGTYLAWVRAGSYAQVIKMVYLK
jgi:hypothetical protein